MSHEAAANVLLPGLGFRGPCFGFGFHGGFVHWGTAEGRRYDLAAKKASQPAVSSVEHWLHEPKSEQVGKGQSRHN